MLPVLGISMGDPAGIGAEIAVKALAKNDWTQKCVPVVIGDAAAMADAVSFTGCDCRLNKIEDPSQAVNEPGVINLIDLGFLTPHSWEYKKVSALAGKAAFHYVREATELAMQGKTDAIVTGPINKEAINLAGYHYSGHTEILADLTGTKDYAMLLTGGNLLVIHAGCDVNPEWLPQEEKFRAPCRAYIALIGCHFVSHPPRCAVTVRPVVSHPLTDGVCAFTCRDEQYVVEVTAADAEPLLETESESGGRQIGGYLRPVGTGKIVLYTPGHTLSVWQDANWQRLLRNTIRYLARE